MMDIGYAISPKSEEQKKKNQIRHKKPEKKIAQTYGGPRPMTLYTYNVQCMCIEIISLLHVFMNVDNRHVGVQKVSHLSWFACVRRPFALLHFVSITNSKSATFFPTEFSVSQKRFANF